MVAQSKAHRRRTCAHLDRTDAEHGPLARPIGGKAPLPEFTKYQISGLLEGVKYDPKDVPEGTAIYVAACRRAGVDKGGNIKKLGHVSTETIANLKDFVFKGPFRDQGMPDFTAKLKDEDVVKIQAFIQGTADAVRPKK